MAWFWIILALVYIISPYDLLPDFIPLSGWLDDGVILFFIIRYIARFYRSRSTNRQGSRSRNTYDHSRDEAHTGKAGHGESAQSDPYITLGVPSDATQDEIQKAYRKLANQYHPDKVAHLGKEFQDLADKRFKEIQNAYDQLRTSV